MNKRKLINILIEVLYYLIFFAYLLIVKSTYSINVSYDLNTFLVVSLVIIGIMLICGSHINKYVGLLLGSIFSLYLIAQRIYNRGFNSYFRFATALQLYSEVADQKGAVGELTKFSDFIPLIILLVITIIFLVLRYIFKVKTKYKWYVRLSAIICFLVSFLLMNTMVNKINATYDEEGNFTVYNTDFYVYDTLYNPESFVKKFGLITYGIRDGQKLIKEQSDISNYKTDVDEYFSSVNKTISTNEYTGLFKDKSLIVIQAESLNNLGISEELTPTLYSMMNSSIKVTDFNTPTLIGSTSDSEFMANTAFIPEAEGYSVVYQYVNNSYPLTLGNLFKDNGFKTNAFHNNYAIYYNRSTTFENYGYEFFDCYLMGLESEQPDSNVGEQIAYIDSEKDKFMTFWITYSGHQTYEYGSVGASQENVDKIKELYPNLDEEYVVYLAKTMDFDESVQNIINVLDWTGRLEDTVIIIYGDHKAKSIYFEKGSNYDEIFGLNEEDNPEIMYTPLFIWSYGMEETDINKYATALDLLPTICNLWDIKYDAKYSFGNDILDPNYEGFAFDSNGNYWNSNFYYDSSTSTITTYNGYSESKAQSLVDQFNEEREICKKILKIDYFASDK